MSSLRRFSALIPAAGPDGVLELQGGNFFLLLTANASVDIRVERGAGGHAEQFDAQTGGFLVRRITPWSNLRILGPVGTTVTYMVGTADTDVDDTDIRLQIATIAGVAAVTEQPSTGFTDTPAVIVNAATTAQAIAATPGRKRVSITNLSANSASLFVRATLVSANDLYEIQPGTQVEFVTSAAIFLRNNSGAAMTALVLEEF